MKKKSKLEKLKNNFLFFFVLTFFFLVKNFPLSIVELLVPSVKRRADKYSAVNVTKERTRNIVLKPDIRVGYFWPSVNQ